MADRVGQQLGNYRLVRLLGQGGFADVYLGEHLYLDSQAAIKVMHTHLAAEEWESFRKEARLIAGLIHPHIVRLLDFDVTEGVPFLVMQYAPNGTLRQRHTKGNPLAPAVILPYVQQVASALQYVHERRLVHRDIKPENLLIGSDNEILLSDFGVAIIAQSSRQQSMQNVGGTVAYMAPEQIQSRPCPASDQYALGVVVYEWLTGERPFEGSFAELASKQLLIPPPALHSRMPTISPEVEAVVLRALAKEPQERFPSVQAFAQALGEAASVDGGATLVAPRSLRVPSDSASLHLEETSFTTRVLVSARLPMPSAPTLPLAAPPAPAARRVSRRSVLAAGLTGLALAGGSLTWYALSRTASGVRPPSVHPTAHPTAPPTATIVPLGTTLFIYEGHNDPVYAVAWSPDGTRIASGSGSGESSQLDDSVQVWDALTGRALVTYSKHTNAINDVAWSPDSRLVASASYDATVQVWDAASGSTIFTYRGHTDHAWAVAWSPDGKLVASGGKDRTVQVWMVGSEQPFFIYRGHTDGVGALSWSPDGKYLASGSHDATVQVWSIGNAQPLFIYRGHKDRVNTVAWSPKGQYLASGSGSPGNHIDETVQVWVPFGRQAPVIYRGHGDQVNTVAWSPDGKRIASGGGNTSSRTGDKTVQIWEALSGTHLYSYNNHRRVVESLAWSPDGSRIVSGGDDLTAQVWVAV